MIRKMCGLVLLILVFAGCTASDTSPNYDQTCQDPETTIRDFPSIHLTSELDPFDIERELWHDASMTVVLCDGAVEIDNAGIRLRGRGNSTWNTGVDKRPLRVRFNEPQPFLSEHSARDWILLANHFDMSLLRNYGALYLGSLMENLDFTPMVQNVHLYVNGEYMGIYMLTDERDLGENRVQLTFDEDPALSEYFFELDEHLIGWQAGVNTIGVDYFVVNDRPFDVRFPGGSQRTPAHMAYMQNFMERVDEAFESRDFEAISSLVHIDTMIDFYIVQELFKNNDIGGFSVFMQIRGQGEDRRLYFGPIWDFDRSAGNTFYWTTHEFIFAGWGNHWFAAALDTPELRELIIARWMEVYDNQIAQMIGRLEYFHQNYEEVFERNFTRHLIRENRPHWFYDRIPIETRDLQTWDEQMTYLIEWLNLRVFWLTRHFSNM